jgi:4-aminobutyrate aminotransferase
VENKIRMKTALPGPASSKILNKLQQLNGGWSISYPFVHSSKGEGCFCTDIDGNTFLDFGSQIASNPLGYNHPALLAVSKEYIGRSPLKFAGQDFTIKEHLDLLEELVSITPKNIDTGFLINSGAEAVENAIKIALRSKPTAKLGISFTGAFHGRTIGALSCTNSKIVHKKNYLSMNMRRLLFDETAPQQFEEMLQRDTAPEDVGFVIVEHIQGEGGYRIASKKMITETRKIAKQNHIPFIADEVQSGIGRTGHWWAFEHFAVEPDVITSAKALQVGATLANKKLFPSEPGSISSTWGGGHALDMANGIATIQTIKKEKLLTKNTQHGTYLRKGLEELALKNSFVQNIRGLGLMNAFDLPTKKMRDDLVLQLLKQGVIVLGCGKLGIRILPPYVVEKRELDLFLGEVDKALSLCNRKGPVHTGAICRYGMCAEGHS